MSSKLQDDFRRKFASFPTIPRETMKYTGTKMIGIAQIPKSNAQPVFSAQEAKDTVKVK